MAEGYADRLQPPLGEVAAADFSNRRCNTHPYRLVHKPCKMPGQACNLAFRMFRTASPRTGHNKRKKPINQQHIAYPEKRLSFFIKILARFLVLFGFLPYICIRNSAP